MAANFKMAATLPKMVYSYVYLLSDVFLNDFHYLWGFFYSTKKTNHLHLIHVFKSKMASNFKMAAILP